MFVQEATKPTESKSSLSNFNVPMSLLLCFTILQNFSIKIFALFCKLNIYSSSINFLPNSI